MPNPINLVVLEPGVGEAVQSAMGPWLTENGLILQVIQATDWTSFVTLLQSPTNHAAMVPAAALAKTAERDLLKSLTPNKAYFWSKGSFLVVYQDEYVGLETGALAQVLAVPAVTTLDATLLSFLHVGGWLFHGGGAPVNAADENTFDFDVEYPPGTDLTKVPPEIKGSEIDCEPQEFKIKAKASNKNSKMKHVKWKKTPPAGTTSVERHGLDNEGDAPKGKTPSTAKFDPAGGTASWSVPMCSNGEYEVTITVTWECLIDGVQHDLEKKIKIKRV